MASTKRFDWKNFPKDATIRFLDPPEDHWKGGVIWMQRPKAYPVVIPEDSWEDIFEMNYNDDGDPRPEMKREVLEWCREVQLQDPDYGGGIYRSSPKVEKFSSYHADRMETVYQIVVNFDKELDGIYFKLRWIG